MKAKAVAGRQWYKEAGTTPQEEYERSVRNLKKLLKKGDVIYTLITRKSNYRMRVRFFVARCMNKKEASIADITWDVAHALQANYNDKGAMVGSPSTAVSRLSHLLFGETYALRQENL